MRPLFSSSTQVHLEGPNQGGAVEMERTNGFQKRWDKINRPPWLIRGRDGSSLGWRRRLKRLGLKHPWDIQLDKTRAAGYLNPSSGKIWLEACIWGSYDNRAWLKPRTWQKCLCERYQRQKRGPMVEPWGQMPQLTGWWEKKAEVGPQRAVSLKPGEEVLVYSISPPSSGDIRIEQAKTPGMRNLPSSFCNIKPKLTSLMPRHPPYSLPPLSTSAPLLVGPQRP